MDSDLFRVCQRRDKKGPSMDPLLLQRPCLVHFINSTLARQNRSILGQGWVKPLGARFRSIFCIFLLLAPELLTWIWNAPTPLAKVNKTLFRFDSSFIPVWFMGTLTCRALRLGLIFCEGLPPGEPWQRQPEEAVTQCFCSPRDMPWHRPKPN